MSMIRWLANVWRRSWKRTRRPWRSRPEATAARRDGSPTQHPLRDVVVQERGATRGCEHVIGPAGETGAAFVLAQNREVAAGGASTTWIYAPHGFTRRREPHR